ncbi:MAG: glycosyltransferase family 2 protein [Chloroflexi bacterium]|nr:glycosyltransferase family 2 protein [Chloroflexota bacterium]
MSSPALIYAIVLHWRTPGLTTRCVESLAALDRCDTLFRLRVLVVDNGSGDVPDFSACSGLSVETISLTRNLGYAGGNNVGLRHAWDAGATWALLLNSDVVLAPDCLVELLRVASVDHRIGIVGPLVLRESQPDRIQSNGQRFGRWTARHTEIDRGGLATSIDTAPHIVDAVSGCALMVRRELADSVGPLDEQFFLYFEDLDWCLRARRSGFGVMCIPAARVWHRGGASIGRSSPRTTLYSVRNHLALAVRATGWRRGQLTWPLIVAYHAAYILANREQWTLAHVRALVLGVFHGVAGRLGEEPSI